MKCVKKIMALALAMVMVLAMGVTAFAVDTEPTSQNGYGVSNDHTITINNTNALGAHTYAAYQVFKGNLNAAENVLSDIDWGTGVNGAEVLTALKAETFTNRADFASAEKASDVAKVLAGYKDDYAKLDAFARVVGEHLATVAGTSTQNGTSYSINVTGDGYYFIKDTTTPLAEGDTYSKFMLNVVKNVTVNAKDTTIKPDKKIVDGDQRVAENSAAIGDTVTFEVKIDVPDTTQYKDRFVLVMNDKLPAGLTLMGVTSVKVGEDKVPYTMTVKAGESYVTYTAPESAAAAVTAPGGQEMKIVFNNFKTFAETSGKNYIGQKIVVTYTAVVNEDAVYGATGNKNEVAFDYSNDPNHTYSGDEFGNNDPKGTTPNAETKTLVTGLEILKVDGSNNNSPLAGAEFEITGNAYNTTLVTAETFVPATEGGTHWKLKDGTYTTTDPAGGDINDTQYESTTQKYKLETVTNVVTVPEDTKITATSNAEGKIIVKGLKPGEYTIKETHAPDGYNKIDTEFKIVVAWEMPTSESSDELKTSGGFSKGEGTSTDVTMENDGTLYKISIQNNKGTVLPSTGGIGTTIFYVLGSILVIGAAVLLIARKRMSSNEK